MPTDTQNGSNAGPRSVPATGARLRLRTRVLVVIPTRDEKDQIGAVLARLLEETADFAQLRVVVADGGSTDGTRDIVAEVARRNPAVVLLDNPARIQSAAVNLAVRRFGDGADVLIRCDAHSFYPPRYCRTLVETLQRMNAASVVVPLDSIGQSCLQRAIAWVSSSPIGTGSAAHRAGHRSGFVDHGHHAAFRMGAFRRVGGYDESFTYNEDAELDCRQRALGGRAYLDAEIRIGYRPLRSLAALARSTTATARGARARCAAIRPRCGSARRRCPFTSGSRRSRSPSRRCGRRRWPGQPPMRRSCLVSRWRRRSATIRLAGSWRGRWRRRCTSPGEVAFWCR